MHRDDYKPRLVDRQVEEYLSAMGAVVIEGPKWCGKTWTSSQHCRSEFMTGSPEGNFQNKHLAELSPETVLVGDTPRMLDEWQEVPALWDAVRAEVDKRNAKGQFILTGSATPNRKGILHSGAGRIGRIRMRPMSLYESGASSGKVSLLSFFEGGFTPCLNGEVSIQYLAELIVRGGWPGNLDTPNSAAGIIAGEYIRALLENDVYRLDEKKRDPHKMNLLLRSLARNESTTASVNVLKRDISGVDGENIEDDTITTYLDVLRRLFILDNQQPFAPATRSSIRIKQAEKRHQTPSRRPVPCLRSAQADAAGINQRSGNVRSALRSNVRSRFARLCQFVWCRAVSLSGLQGSGIRRSDRASGQTLVRHRNQAGSPSD